MSTLFSFRQIIKALANISISLVCVITITLLTSSCSTTPTKQTASTDTAANLKPELECRTVSVTGSRFTKKVCEYKETWAAIDKKNSESKDEFVNEINRQSSIPNSASRDPSGGSSRSAMTP